jgi:general secretion pathway protein C
MVSRVLNTLSIRLATPFTWLMVAGIAYTVATSLMTMIGGGESGSGSAPAAAPEATTTSAVDIESLIARNLFGVAGARPANQTAAEPAAVATQLPLELQGVFVAEGDGASAAIIAQRGRPGILYTVGQDVAGSATLESVAPDHVVLRRSGNAESLHFPQASNRGMASSGTVDDEPMDMPYEDTESYDVIDEAVPEEMEGDPEAAASDADAQPDAVVARYREQLNANPEETLQSLGMTPVNAGTAAGYRIGNVGNIPGLGQTGLQSGDVILSVNGRPVGDLQQDRGEIDAVLAQGSARIEVQRGTRRFFVTASLP